MITPAVLILACSSLVLATSQRLARVMDRIRAVNEELSSMLRDNNSKASEDLYRLLTISIKRARLLQISLAALYFSLTTFIAVSFSIGITDIIRSNNDWIAVVLGVTGVLLLFCSSALLIQESRLAYRSINIESRFILSLRRDCLKLIPERKGRKWKIMKRSRTPHSTPPEKRPSSRH